MPTAKRWGYGTLTAVCSSPALLGAGSGSPDVMDWILESRRGSKNGFKRGEFVRPCVSLKI